MARGLAGCHPGAGPRQAAASIMRPGGASARGVPRALGGHVMRCSEIFHGGELQVSLIVHDDGRKAWDWVRHAWQASDDLQTAIEQAADADPQAERWTYQTLTIRQSQLL